ncbi:MAG TPA: hypothetical protein VF283_20170 [Bryobacteraceae bacterium]
MAQWRIENIDKQAVKDHFNAMLSAQERTITDSSENLEGLRRVWEPRIAFIEKLILLNTGMFALSLSFLGALGSHAAAKSLPHFFLPILYVAWGFLLSAVICGGIHNLMIVRAMEQAFISAGSLRREYRAGDQARWLMRTFGFLTGKIVPDEGENAEEIDISQVGATLQKVALDEFNKATKKAQEQREKSSEAAKQMAGVASRYSSFSLVATFVALICLALAAWQSAWVLLQK